jgi:hypothetical protein
MDAALDCSELPDAQALSIERLAYARWKLFRAPRFSSAEEKERDFHTSQELLTDDWYRDRISGISDPQELWWHKWARSTLRRYIALEVGWDHHGLENELHRREAGIVIAGEDRVRMLVVLDGAPEFSRHVFYRHAGNGVSPKEIISAKDDHFYAICYDVLPICYGYLVDEPNIGSDCVVQGHTIASKRLFQDGCAVVFAGERPFETAVCRSYRLFRELARYNEDNDLPWPSRLHARIAIGANWKDATTRLLSAQRTEIAVGRGLFDKLPHAQQRLLLANGLRVGPYDEVHRDANATVESNEVGRGVFE